MSALDAPEDALVHRLIERRSELIRLVEFKRPRTEAEAKLVEELYLPELASVCLQLFGLLVENPIRSLVTLRGNKESRTKRVMELFSSVGVVSRSLMGAGGNIGGGRASLLEKKIDRLLGDVIPFEFADSGDNVLSASLLMQLGEGRSSKTFSSGNDTPTVGLLYDPSLLRIQLAVEQDAFTMGVVPDLELDPEGKPRTKAGKFIDHSRTETDEFGHPLPKGTIAGLAVHVAINGLNSYNEMLISAKTARIGDAVIGGVLLNGAEHTELATDLRKHLDAEKPDLPIFTYKYDSLVPFQLTAFGGRKRRPTRGGALRTGTRTRTRTKTGRRRRQGRVGTRTKKRASKSSAASPKSLKSRSSKRKQR